ncbi:hypothetical protein BATDEDRAFT_89946 [Batrachochytrium dendrobatidis JAM81]|uniref:Uncharacterized protein n=1 Tax=Batrachochytrium dendrobatidis (strain JAM81 / FGSC 10211) TaxID=684364 RepID=F4P6C1_BATDJ|nr:uncharacterized protein BATDEDRAFT_89946 [Batrachochytrium dendrobatidis JAM81]EGF79323.1 hypothetical protein BATDEDRAFT_89946 [Batrachochytrium dendrobatidis JAM81]|eukprot:XP_006680101.1 hypothetical protein BATDEDRAFT_89946 [Batrachochytrium dendrobatidis JAM81]
MVSSFWISLILLLVCTILFWYGIASAVRRFSKRFGVTIQRVGMRRLNGIQISHDRLHIKMMSVQSFHIGTVGVSFGRRPDSNALVCVFVQNVAVVVKMNPIQDVVASTSTHSNASVKTTLSLDKQIFSVWSFLSNTLVQYIMRLVAIDVTDVHVTIQDVSGICIYETKLHSLEIASILDGAPSSCISKFTQKGFIPSASKCGAEMLLALSPYRFKAYSGETVFECQQPTLFSIALVRSSWNAFLIANINIDHPTIRTLELAMFQNILKQYTHHTSDSLQDGSTFDSAMFNHTELQKTALIDTETSTDIPLPTKAALDILEALTCMAPRVSIEINHAAVVHVFENALDNSKIDFDTKSSTASFKPNSSHTILFSFKLIELLAKIDRDAGRNRVFPKIEMRASVEESIGDLMSFDCNKKSVSHFFSVKKASFNASFGHEENSSICILKCATRIMSPHIILDPHVLDLFQIYVCSEASINIPSHTKPKPDFSNIFLMDAGSLFGLNQLDIIFTVNIADVLIGIQVPIGEPDHIEQSNLAQISFKLDLFSISTSMHLLLLSTAISSSHLAVDRIELCKSTIDVLFTGAGLHTQLARTTSKRLSALFPTTESLSSLETLVSSTNMAVNLVLEYSDRCFSVQSAVDIESIIVDLSWLATGSLLDYFAVVLALWSLLGTFIKKSNLVEHDGLPNVPEPHNSADGSLISLFEIEVSSTAVLKQLSVILVGQVDKSGLIGSVKAASVNAKARYDDTSLWNIELFTGNIETVDLLTFLHYKDFSTLIDGALPTHSVLCIQKIQFMMQHSLNLASPLHTASDSSIPESGRFSLISVESTQCLVDISFVHCFIILNACIDVVKILTLVTPFKAIRDKTPDSLVLGPVIPLAKISICSIFVKIELPDKVKIQGTLDQIKSTIYLGGTGQVELKSMDAQVYLQNSDIFKQLLLVQDITVGFTPSAPATAANISFAPNKMDITIPYGFEMSEIVENAINLVRALKSIFRTFFGHIPSNSSDPGRTFIIKESIPNIRCCIQMCTIHIEDDPFVSRLSRNYRVGLPENFSRISRERAFWKQAKQREAKQSDGTFNPNEIDKAWKLLEEFNSRAYIEAINKSSQDANDEVYLLAAVLEGIDIVVSAPSLLELTVEETLNTLDYNTPSKLIYDDLIPRDISVGFHSIDIRLRDYPFSLLKVPASPRGTTWLTKGLLVIAEPLLPVESRRTVYLPLKDLSIDPIIVTRSVSPTKIYLHTTTVIKCNSAICAYYGASLEPCLSDLVSVIDSFTKPNADPSPPVGWWDKLRLMLHGTNEISISGGGELRLRVLGSMSPYYDPLKHFGMDGIELSLGSGVHFNIGAPQSNDIVLLEAGEVRFALPQKKSLAQGAAQEMNDTLAKFSGGVRIAFGVRFTTFRPVDGPNFPPIEVHPWKTHADIVLRSPEFCHSPSLGQVWDSFHGFRSEFIHMHVEITSPKPYFSGLVVPSSHLCMNSSSFSQVQIMTMVYQSILTSIPLRTRVMFFTKPVHQGVPTSPKPKLGRALSTVRLVTTLKPLVITLIAEQDDLTGGVGLRGRTTHMESDVLFRQHKLTHIDDGNISISRRPAYRWDLEESQMSFEDIEGCTLTYTVPSEPGHCSATPVDADEDAASIMDNEIWTFAEDAYYTLDASVMQFTPFLWSPRLLYFRRGTSSDHHHLHEKDFFDKQLALLTARMHEIEATIWILKEEQKGIESRMAVFFDTSIEKESAGLVDRLTMLYEKRALIQNAIKDLIESLEMSDNSTFIEESAAKQDMQVFKHHYVFHNICFLWKVPVRNAIIKLIDLQTKNFAIKYCLSNAAAKVVSELIRLIGEQRSMLKASTPASTLPGSKSKKSDDTNTANKQSTFTNYSSESMAQLLDQLLHDLALGIRTNIPNETEAEFDHIYVPPSPEKTELNSKFRKISRYTPSFDINSPDYLAPGQMVESDSVITLINPQVAYEVVNVADPLTVQSVIVASTGMELLLVTILDEVAAAARQGYEDKDRNDAIVKYRTIVNVHEAQFFIRQETDHDTMSYTAYPSRNGQDDMDSQYNASRQCWVPLECFLDTSSVDPRFVRIVEHASANFHRDKMNPLYFTRSSAFATQQTDTHFLSLPQFCIAMNSAQYMLVHQVITSLLVYNDPAAGKLAERLRKVMLALEQLPDLREMQDMVLSLQERVRQTDSVVKSNTTTDSQRQQELRRSLIQGRNELHVLMEALKGTQQIEKQRNSEGLSYQLCVKMDKFVWLMLLENNDPFLRCTFTNPAIMWVHREDQVSINTLEIETLYVENLHVMTSEFKDAISPYIPDRHGVDFKRNKMLRLYLRELAPVAGIQVVDHFEIDMFPLSIQVTYELGKQFMRYIFPNKKNIPASSTATASGDAHSSSPYARTIASVDENDRPRSQTPDTLDTVSVSRRGKQTNEWSSTHTTNSSSATTATAVVAKSSSASTHTRGSGKRRPSRALTELKQMQARASENRSFIYIKLPGVLHCLSYRGLKEKNLEDLHMFEFYLPTLEYRNKTWTWYEFVNAVKRDTMRAALANTGALVREKLFQKRKPGTVHSTTHSSIESQTGTTSSTEPSEFGSVSYPVDGGLHLGRSESVKSSYSGEDSVSTHGHGHAGRRMRDRIGNGKGIIKSLMRRMDRKDESSNSDVDDLGNLEISGDHDSLPDNLNDGASMSMHSSENPSYPITSLTIRSQSSDHQQQQKMEDELLAKGRLIFGKYYPD